MEKIRVLHVIDSLGSGGTENRCLEIIEGLNERGFITHLAYFNGSGPLRDRLDSMHVLHKEVRVGSYMRPAFVKGLFTLAQLMKAARIQVVQTYGCYSNVPGIIASWLARVPVIVASRRDMGEFLTPTQRWMDQWLWRFTDRVVVNANPIKEALVRDGVSQHKLAVIHNGVDCSLFESFRNGFNHSTQVIGMVANFRKQKDHETFIDAAKLVLKRIPKARFILVGTGPRELEVCQYARAQGVSEHISFMGMRSGSDLVDILNSLTISVLSSHGNEGVPNVVLEGMAMRKPVVASDVGGTRDALENGVTGFLVPPRDSRALAEKILWLLDHPDVAEKMGLEGYRRLKEQFSLSRMQEEFAQLYCNLLQVKGVRCAS